MALDSFDEELLEQPYEDRQRQAARGRARLSLVPKASRYYSIGASSQPQLTLGVRDRPLNNLVGETLTPNLAQFAINTTQQPQESSSDPQIGPSSSPAFKASMRRAENYNPSIPTTSAKIPARKTEKLTTECLHRQGNAPPHLINYQRVAPKELGLPHTLPIVQGIELVPVTKLPDRIRVVFPFPVFNAIQSRSFTKIYRSDDNFVLASPTGSGKTAIMELAICRAITNGTAGQYKIVYQAPTKSLCSERQRDWERKFKPLNLQCAELTGDSESSDLKNVQCADIIITTPEKWDSITRKWKDHEKLMKLIRLFLIDEVHILKEDRGAILEAVVSRMKTIGTDVRFVALSATVPNFEDVALWLGKSAREPHEPAANERFGEDFRPVKLKKHICGYTMTSNDFVFEKFLDGRLPDIIAKYSEQKPIMIFCFTRNSTVSTAKLLAKWWASQTPQDQYWGAPSEHIPFQDKDLGECVASGVAFHHAGLDTSDRLGVENGFLKGDINVICCTSTLAVGVNLPCHFVIIKNTVAFTNNGLQEYSDLEIMQMLGRAGRPQFDNSAVAVIMTRQAKVRRYEMMVTGQEQLESKLHLNLIGHLNAEVGLGTIRDHDSAKKWLSGTFLYVRLQRNPEYYKLEGSRSDQAIDEQLDDICARGITLLQDNSLVTKDSRFKCTELGHAMARYYVHFETMQTFVALQPRASISEILSALVQASEFQELRLRAAEKALYRNINNSPAIRFHIPVSLNTPAHKVSLLVQSILGSADISWDNKLAKHKPQYNNDISIVFKHIHRLIRCVIDCQLCLGDSVAIRNALMLERSLASHAWDDSPLQMKQIDGLGAASVRKLVNAGIRSIEDLEYTEPHRIEIALTRNPPFGLRILDRLKSFPKLRISISERPNSIEKTSDGVKVHVKVEIGFLNERPPKYFDGKPIYLCTLLERSDGQKIHFTRISGVKLNKGQDMITPVMLTSVDQSINCYVMCDGIAGTMRIATMKPKIMPSMFPIPEPSSDVVHSGGSQRPKSNMSRRRVEDTSKSRRASSTSDEFGDDGIDDDDLVKASVGDLDFDHIENYSNPTDQITRKNTAKNAFSKAKARPSTTQDDDDDDDDDDDESRQLENGKWACNHKCKDKNACRHMCCRDGLDKPPKKPVKKVCRADGETLSQTGSKKQGAEKKSQTKLQLMASKRKSSAPVEVLDLTQQEKKQKTDYAMRRPRDSQNLSQLHKSIQKKDPPTSISSIMHKKPAYCYAEGGGHTLSFLDNGPVSKPKKAESSEYNDFQIDELSSHFGHPENNCPRSDESSILDNGNLSGWPDTAGKDSPRSRRSDLYDNDSVLEDAMVGLVDSQNLKGWSRDEDAEDLRALGRPLMGDCDDELQDKDWDINAEFMAFDKNLSALREMESSSSVQVPKIAHDKGRSLFFNDMESPQPTQSGFKSAKSVLKGKEIGYLREGDSKQPQRHSASIRGSKAMERDENVRGESMETLVREINECGEEVVPEAFKGLEPWLLREFGDIVELVEE
ncbi:P-loop containing nucleoside triphosphate hydrolase protein [Lojkania enalia]|uniref:DNA 3'-5' helicase n=1 Tax=Lojkania enalia TaxID=147567 RepID=A0A9P4N1X7_9PLEO|nr:P-loop containing nucleoside triphosphate hydrolase protein [Didymosphaeria enalia]